VRDGRVVGRGWHRAYGGPHAEVEALRSAGARARGATVYVSLEPCSSTGRTKKTAPCVDALAAAGVARVVWAQRDPDPRNGGRAARALARAGLASAGPVPVPGAAALLGAFRAGLSRARPWVLWKWASSLDGRVAPAMGAARCRALAPMHDRPGASKAWRGGDGVRTTAADVPPRGQPTAVTAAAVVFDPRADAARLPPRRRPAPRPTGAPPRRRVVPRARALAPSRRRVVEVAVANEHHPRGALAALHGVCCSRAGLASRAPSSPPASWTRWPRC
jgi:pyrimidine deaminase RibD-like protein